MTAAKTPQMLAESIMKAQLARQHEFASKISDSNAAFTKKGTYGGGSWYGERNRLGKDELRERKEIIREAWRQALCGQSPRSANKLRLLAAKHAKTRFLTEAREVIDMAVPKAGSRFHAGDSKVLDAAAKEMADELYAVLLLPPSPPEKSWLVQQLQEQISNVIKVVAGILMGILIARAGDVWRWIQSLLWFD